MEACHQRAGRSLPDHGYRGLKTCYDIVSMKEESKDENSVYHKVTVMLKEKLDKGEGGVNSGKGFYDYTKK